LVDTRLVEIHYQLLRRDNKNRLPGAEIITSAMNRFQRALEGVIVALAFALRNGYSFGAVEFPPSSSTQLLPLWGKRVIYHEWQ
jgi:hypothetical protein